MSKNRNIADLGSNDVLETTASGVSISGTVATDRIDITDYMSVTYGSMYAEDNMEVYGNYLTKLGKVRDGAGWKDAIVIENSQNLTQDLITLDAPTTVGGNLDVTGTATVKSGAITVRNSDYENGLKINRDLDVATVGAAGVKLKFGAINNGSDVYPVEIVGVTDTDGTAGWLDVNLDGSNKFKVKSNGDVVVANGNVGIGVSDPSDRLDVLGQGRFHRSYIYGGDNYALKITSNYGDGVSSYISNISSTNRMELSSGAYYYGASLYQLTDGSTGMGVLSMGQDGQLLYQSANGAVANSTVDPSVKFAVDADGNFGVGTVSPVYNLHVHEPTASTASYIQVTNAVSGGAATDGLSIGVNTVGESILFNRDNTDLRIGTSNQDRLCVTAGGRVGAGTRTPDNYAEVEFTDSGTVGAQGINITNTNITTNSRAGICFRNYDNYGAMIASPRTGSSKGAMILGTNPGGATGASNITRGQRITDTGMTLASAVGVVHNYDPNDSTRHATTVMASGTDNDYHVAVGFNFNYSISQWEVGHLWITASNGRTGLEARSAAWFLIEFQVYNGSVSGVNVVSSGGDTGSLSVASYNEGTDGAGGVNWKVRVTGPAFTSYTAMEATCTFSGGIKQAYRSAT